VQRDVCGLSAKEGQELSVWAARAFLEATVRELPPNPKRVYSRNQQRGNA
jgi:hypothetical protein